MLRQSISDVHKNRRKVLMALPGAQGTLFIFPSHPEQIRNDDVYHPYRQDSSLYYLTGFPEAESLALLVPSDRAGVGHRYILFVRDRNREREIWEGERYGVERAGTIFQADEVFSISEFSKKLLEFLPKAKQVAYPIGFSHEMDTQVYSVLDEYRKGLGRSGRSALPLVGWKEMLGELRLRKDAEEIQHMRKAGEISAIAHRNLMEFVRPGMNEYEIEAKVDYEFRVRGCARLGYPSIVAGGQAATCLHYRFNNQTIKEGELLLVDAGGEYEYFTADITRTFPIGKTFSKEQAALYDIVLKAQKLCLSSIKPGMAWEQVHKISAQSLAEGLLQLGLLKGTVQSVLADRSIIRFFPHGTGHFLGMDVHDIGQYKLGDQSRILEPGMAFTVEPGLYVQPDDTDAPAAYKGIGIRIEDDVVVTDTGVEVLTSLVPKEREEILALRQKAY